MMVFILIIYLAIVNVLSFVTYRTEGKHPEKRISPVFLFLFTTIGGSFGAIVSNYIYDTEYRECRYILNKPLCYLPPFLFIIHIAILGYVFEFWNKVYSIFMGLYDSTGIWFCILIIINVLAFVFIAVRKSSYYFAKNGRKVIEDIVLIPVLLLGGATGGCLSKIMFNFGEDWTGVWSMTFQNFLYNKGMFIVAFVQMIAVAAFYYMFM